MDHAQLWSNLQASSLDNELFKVIAAHRQEREGVLWPGAESASDKPSNMQPVHICDVWGLPRTTKWSSQACRKSVRLDRLR